MTNNNKASQLPKNEDENEGKDEPEGYPLYPPSEDIYNQGQLESDLDPDDLVHKKAPNELPDAPNEKDFNDDKTGSDLDIPGAELDDDMEDVGSEDEENNYYSFGQ